MSPHRRPPLCQICGRVATAIRRSRVRLGTQEVQTETAVCERDGRQFARRMRRAMVRR